MSLPGDFSDLAFGGHTVCSCTFLSKPRMYTSPFPSDQKTILHTRNQSCSPDSNCKRRTSANTLTNKTSCTQLDKNSVNLVNLRCAQLRVPAPRRSFRRDQIFTQVVPSTDATTRTLAYGRSSPKRNWQLGSV